MKSPPLNNFNQLLAKFPKDSLERLRKHSKLLDLEVGMVLYEPHLPIEQAYFPNYGALSAIVVMQDGGMIEVATVGNEGGVGIGLSSGLVSPHQMVVQVAGSATRINADELEREVQHSESLRHVFERYLSAFMFQVSQSVACNGLHALQQRCCRWLLMMHDRVQGDEIGLTHEYLSIMLGVRRASVTEVLQALEDQGFLHTSRGRITISDRAGMEATSCECYAVVRAEYVRMLGKLKPTGQDV